MNFLFGGNESVLRPVTSILIGTNISRFSQREKVCDFVMVVLTKSLNLLALAAFLFFFI